MTEQIFWVWAVEITGSHDDFVALMNEMIAAAETNEPDTVMYQWFLSDDKKTCHVLERYADSNAVLTHLQNVGANFRGAIRDLLQPTKFTVYGSPNEAAAKALQRGGAKIMGRMGGFTR